MSKGQNILLIGCTGFIGRGLVPILLARGYNLYFLSRQPRKALELSFNSIVYNDFQQIREKNFHGVVNLAGAGIADVRWTTKRKRLVRDSRIETTQAMTDWIRTLPQAPQVVLQGSACGYYGFDEAQEFIEEDPPAQDFLGRLAQDWEGAAAPLVDLDIRLCVARTSLVFGPRGGALGKILPPFRLGLGGRLGSGKQWMSWIHYDDEVNALIHLLENPSCQGAYNLAAPQWVSNQAFTEILGQVLGRPTLFPVPAAALRVILGEMSCLLLQGSKVSCGKLLESGFDFQYPDLSAALGQICSNS